MNALVSQFPLSRWQYFRPSGLRDRIREGLKYYDETMRNHSSDPTGALGEDHPLYFREIRQFTEWKANRRSRSQNQQAHRQSMRDVQQELGTVQPPLGPGNPALRSEIAGENAPQREGPQELADRVQIAAVGDNSLNTTGPASSQRSRRRSVSPNPGTNGATTRSNRRRVSGNSILDEIAESRANLNGIAATISNMAGSVEPRNQNITNPADTLQTMQQNMYSIVNSMGSPQRRATDERFYHAWNGLLNQFAADNNIQIPPAMPPAAPTNANNEEINSDDTDNG